MCVYMPPKFAEVGPVACQGDLIERVVLYELLQAVVRQPWE
jgi:hypothetical protein